MFDKPTKRYDFDENFFTMKRNICRAGMRPLLCHFWHKSGRSDTGRALCAPGGQNVQRMMDPLGSKRVCVLQNAQT